MQLHNQIIADLKRSLDSAIRIGELLTEQKENLNHGEFGPWIKSNLPFTDRTAQNYMRLYRERDRLKTETVSDLKSAYKLLAEPKYDFKRLRRELDAVDLIKDPDLQLKECLRIRDVALSLGQECAEKVLRHERKIGEMIIEYEELYGDFPSDEEIAEMKRECADLEQRVKYAEGKLLEQLKTKNEILLDTDLLRVLYDHPPMPKKWDYDESVKKMKRLIPKRRKLVGEILKNATVAEIHCISVSKFCRDTGLEPKRINKLLERIKTSGLDANIQVPTIC